MEKIFLLTLLVLAVAVVMLSVGILFRGRFSNSHVSGNPALRRKGIGCVQSQDREARRKPRFSLTEIERAVSEGLN